MSIPPLKEKRCLGKDIVYCGCMAKSLLMKTRFKLLAFMLLSSTLLVTHTSHTQAQIQSLEIVSAYQISDENYTAGDIIARIFPDNLLKRARKENNEYLLGVLVPKDLAVATYQETETEQFVAQRGVFPVNVTNLNGNIYPGDYITSSSIPGKGQKSVLTPEPTLGLAIEEYTPDKGTPFQYEGATYYSGQIRVDLSVIPEGQKTGALKDILAVIQQLGLALISKVQTSEGANVFIRYALAAILTIITVYFAFRHFGVAILNGIEAIGRNPLARKHIQSAIIINAIIIILVSLSVVVLSLVIIKL